MNFKWDLNQARVQRRRAQCARAICTKRSQSSTARPRAQHNLLSKDPRLTGI